MASKKKYFGMWKQERGQDYQGSGRGGGQVRKKNFFAFLDDLDPKKNS